MATMKQQRKAGTQRPTGSQRSREPGGRAVEPRGRADRTGIRMMRIDIACFVCYVVSIGRAMNLSEALRDAIGRDGRSLFALSFVSGVDRGVLSRFMRGERDIGLKLASKLADALGLELRPVRRRKGR
jgi:hypothetical protein